MSETILDEFGDHRNRVDFDVSPFTKYRGRCCAKTKSGKPCRGRRRLHRVGDRLYCVGHAAQAIEARIR